jgi:redox-sensitive bicupin YhaK (pirin superfamily)
MNDSIVLPQPVFDVQRATERASFDFGWLRTSHSFSFADYYDPRNVNWGALRVFNDDHVVGGKGFGTHPHRDMEIVTYVLSGQLEHRDSIGSHGVVGPGGVQFMSAGTGIQHSEFNHSATDELHFLQMWVLPGRLGVKPEYGQMEFRPEERENMWLLVASGQPGLSAPVALTQDASFRVSRLSGHTLRHTFAPGRLGFFFVASGDIAAAAFDGSDVAVGAPATLGAGDGVRIAGVTRLDITGSGEVVLWDVPRPPDGAND